MDRLKRRIFRGERLEDAYLSHARLHSSNFEDTRITDGWLRNADDPPVDLALHYQGGSPQMETLFSGPTDAPVGLVDGGERTSSQGHRNAA